MHRRFQHLQNYRLFRYEDLLAEPEKTLKELCQFIGVDFTDDFLHPERGIHLASTFQLNRQTAKAV